MLLLIGIIIGLVLGLTGAGGSVFAVPLLMLLGGLPMGEAVGISLGAVAISALYGSLRNWRGKNILWLPGVILAVTGAVTAPLGKWLGSQLPSLWLLIGFSTLALIIAGRMWLSASRNPSAASLVRASHLSDEPTPGLLCNLSKTGQFELRPRCMSGLIIGGAGVGVLSGLFGVGGGFLIVPLLLALSLISMAQAVSTSLLIIAAVSGSGFVSHLLISPSNPWLALGFVGAGGVLGMMLGQLLSPKIANARLQKIFAMCLIAVSLTTLAVNF
ncbi:MAG: sulfite exporter TauE/SafE family protein [Marinagarivorans sp.]|nr:sulfite exporter TauE/SafE family protein [Marinagarivorans sp.]